ncbi:site-specific integrase [Methylomonas sp. 11b]|uniref:site-specific integrase n=1 Tax=Methylomonas sp. 11b TaxID=1168169 RepID=UPI00047BA7F7|nr:site-specific integrase [Methylomonas sp. 11b]
MATITKRLKKDGTPVYRAEIVIKKRGTIVHRESKSFLKKKLAADWAKQREVELQENDVYGRKDRLPLGQVIEQYIEEFRPTGRSKLADLTKLIKHDIAKLDVHDLKAGDLIKHVKQRNTECLPQTAGNDLVWIGTVLKTMSGAHELGLDLSIFDAAREVLRKEGLIAKSTRRERRPTKQELYALSRHFAGSWMLHIMWFAIYSARRQNEITQLRWEDINHDKRTILVRGLKDPRKKDLSKWAKLPRSAYKIIMKHGQRKGRIFPYNSKTIGGYFTRACHLLDIQGLHFHDLRHEAASRLSEQGLSIVDMQQVTLHSQWSTLQRYVNLEPGDVQI